MRPKTRDVTVQRKQALPPFHGQVIDHIVVDGVRLSRVGFKTAMGVWET